MNDGPMSLETDCDPRRLFRVVSETLLEGSSRLSSAVDLLRRQQLAAIFFLGLLSVGVAILVTTLESNGEGTSRLPIEVSAGIVAIAAAINLWSTLKDIHIHRDEIRRLRRPVVLSFQHGLALRDAHKLDEYSAASFDLRMIQADMSISRSERYMNSSRKKKRNAE